MKYISGLILIIVVLTSCKNNQKNTYADHTHAPIISGEIPQDFLSFYVKFHSDSLFQLEHIVFPLKVTKEGTAWQKAEWLMHKPFDDQDGQFVQSFVNMSGLIIEHIESVNKLFQMERRFVKSGTEYNLIYYEVTNAFESSQDWEAGGEG